MLLPNSVHNQAVAVDSSPDRGGTQTPTSVIAVIDSCTTEVTFTNTASVNCNDPNLLNNGSFDTGDFTGWTEGGNSQYSTVVSGPYYQYSGAEDATFTRCWVP